MVKEKAKEAFLTEIPVMSEASAVKKTNEKGFDFGKYSKRKEFNVETAASNVLCYDNSRNSKRLKSK